MKTLFVRQCSLGVAAGLTFFLGCARPSAQPEQPKAVAAPTTSAAVVAAPAAADPASAGVAPGTNPPAILQRIAPTVKPEAAALSPGLSEVVKLAQAGVGEEVILAYVEKYSGGFNVGADQILYLSDLGVTGTVITSMLKHDGADGAAVAAAPPAPANAAPNPVSPAPAPPQVTTAVAPPTASTEVSYFYDSLAPYGSWIYLSGYGWCWQPTVAVSVSEWRPYSDRGRWYWSDAGWYWNSDYSWGWAAFHYGRWYNHAGCGWVWAPGVTWAPSWVSWRYSDGYCGWAPLPPEAYYVHGAGFSYYGRHVGVGFEFGLTDFHYSFVSIGNFCDYAPYRHYVPRTTVHNVYRNTTVINNYGSGNNNTVINRGIGRETVARAGQNRIREVSVRETPVANLASVRGDRIEKLGGQNVIVRPQLPKTPPPVTTATFASRTGGQTTPAAGRATAVAPTSGNVPAASTARPQTGTGAGRSAPVIARTTPAAPETHQGPGVANPNANANANSVGTTTARTLPATIPQTRSQPQPQQQSQPRATRSLFGDSGASTTTPQNNNTTVARTTQPAPAPTTRATAQPSYTAPPTTTAPRPYPQYTAPMQAQPSVRSAQPAGGATMSPRGSEQSSRSSTPVYSAPAPRSAPAASTYSAPQSAPRSAPASSGGGGSGGGSGKSDSNSGRSDRQGRNH